MFLNQYINLVNSILPTRVRNEGGWVGAAIAAGSALVGALSSSSPGAIDAGKVRNKTISGENSSDFDVLYDVEAAEAMDNLQQQIQGWAEGDREFFENTFMPFQEELMKTNQSLLPVIEKVASATMEENAKDLFSNAPLKNAFRVAVDKSGQALGDVTTQFVDQLNEIPSKEERVSQAFANTELQFGKVGKQLQRDMASRGQQVSQATKRELAISKATAKAGLADSAAEAARTEKLQALTSGVGILSQAQAGQTNQLLASQGAQQAGLATPQIAGSVPVTGMEATALSAGLAETAATKELGTEATGRQISHTQKGIQGAVELDSDMQLVNQPAPVVRSTSKKKKKSSFDGGPGVGGADAGGGGFGDTGGVGAGGAGSPGEGGAGTDGAGIGGIM